MDHRLGLGGEQVEGWEDGNRQDEDRWRQGLGWLARKTQELESAGGKMQGAGSLLRGLLVAESRRGLGWGTPVCGLESQVHDRSAPCQGVAPHSPGQGGILTWEHGEQALAVAQAHDAQRCKREGSSSDGTPAGDLGDDGLGVGSGAGRSAAESHQELAPDMWQVSANCWSGDLTCAGQSCP